MKPTYKECYFCTFCACLHFVQFMHKICGATLQLMPFSGLPSMLSSNGPVEFLGIFPTNFFSAVMVAQSEFESKGVGKYGT